MLGIPNTNGGVLRDVAITSAQFEKYIGGYMYVTARELTPLPGQLQQTIAFGSELIGVMNSRFGSAMAMSTEIGGNPNKVWLTGFWEDLSSYQSFLENYMADQQMMSAISMSSSFIAEMQDQIGEVIRPPGERKAFAQMHRGRLKSDGVVEGMELILELTNHVSELSGSDAGLVRPVTGDQYGISFVSYAGSLQELKDMTDHWTTDEKYQELFARGPEYFESEFDVTYVRFLGI